MGFNMKKYNISDFGALSDGTLQTEKIQRAIDECFLSGGGIVIIPCGEYLTGGIRLRSNVTLYLKSGAVIKASRNPDDYFSYKNDKNGKPYVKNKTDIEISISHETDYSITFVIKH